MSFWSKNKYRRAWRYGGGRRRYRKKYGKSTLTSRVKKLERSNKAQRPQLEFFDNNVVDADIWTTPSVVALGPVSVTGRKTLKSLQVKFKLDTTSATTQHYRIVIFTDKSNEGAAVPGWADVYDSASINTLRLISPTINEGQRFKILYDKTFTLIKDAGGGPIRDIKYFDMYKKLNIKSINVGGTWWESGGLYIGIMGTSASGVGDLSYNARVRFVEHSTS